MDKQWAVRALGAWVGTLIGIGICFFASVSEFGVTKPGWQPLFLLAGWGMAAGSPLMLMLMKSRWSE